MTKSQKCPPWLKILICLAVIILTILAITGVRNRTQPLLRNAVSVSVQASITHLRVLQGQGFGEDVTHEIDQDELLYLLADTQMRRDRNAWPGTQTAEWVIEFRQSGNRFHRTIYIALGETHGMMVEHGFGNYFFRISNGDEIREALERMVAGDL